MDELDIYNICEESISLKDKKYNLHDEDIINTKHNSEWICDQCKGVYEVKDDKKVCNNCGKYDRFGNSNVDHTDYIETKITYVVSPTSNVSLFNAYSSEKEIRKLYTSFVSLNNTIISIAFEYYKNILLLNNIIKKDKKKWVTIGATLYFAYLNNGEPRNKREILHIIKKKCSKCTITDITCGINTFINMCEKYNKNYCDMDNKQILYSYYSRFMSIYKQEYEIDVINNLVSLIYDNNDLHCNADKEIISMALCWFYTYKVHKVKLSPILITVI